MTDYLEEILDHANALLEQVRRLERSGAGSAGEGGEEPLALDSGARGAVSAPGRKPAGAVPAWESAIEKRADASSSESRAEGRAAPETESSKTLDPPRRILTPLEEAEQKSSPLLEQLERLERAASASVDWSGQAGRQSAQSQRAGAGRTGGYSQALTGSSWGTDYPDGSDLAAEDWFAAPGIRCPGIGGEPGWAEQADRAFRRDSRRYDGGFYLY